MNLVIMQPTLETISKASNGAAFHDLIMGVPDSIALEKIRSQGLERLMEPRWYNQRNPDSAKDGFSHEFQHMLTTYPTPQQYLDYAKMKEQSGNSIIGEVGTNGLSYDESVKRLNYHLIKEILMISPTGKVNETVYKVAIARSAIAVGPEQIRRLFETEYISRTQDPDELKFHLAINDFMMRRIHDWIIELPILETVISVNIDASEIDARFLTKHFPEDFGLPP